MGGQFNIESISSAFAEAAVDPLKWPSAMERVAESTRSFGAGLFPVRGRLPNVPLSRSMAPSFEAYVRDGWIERDERYLSTPIIARRGVATDLDFTSADEIATHPYYQEFLGRFGLRWFAGVKVASGDDYWVCSIQRTIEQGPFSRGELTQLAGLSERLSSAVALAQALGFARAEAALDAFEISGKAVVLFDRCGDVLRINRPAERMLGSHLRIARRRLVCADHDASAAIDRALHATIRSTERPSLLPPVVLPGAEGRPILSYPSRLPGIAADAFAPCQALVVLVDLAARINVVEEDLKRAFKLTSAEARLACRLMGEDALELVATGLGIKYETARNHLKSILWKTGTHRQSQLVALLARFGNGEPSRQHRQDTGA